MILAAVSIFELSAKKTARMWRPKRQRKTKVLVRKPALYVLESGPKNSKAETQKRTDSHPSISEKGRWRSASGS